MLIYPAIDLLGGRCVRLRQGDYAQETVFSNDPLYSTLSLMRAKGITSMSDFVLLLAHQAKVRQASRQIRELPCICCASELPPWFSSYPYVQTNYRANYTARMCVRSMFQLHNETVNICQLYSRTTARWMMMLGVRLLSSFALCYLI